MAEAQYAHNHVIDPETGFLENPAYLSTFGAERKKQFLKVFQSNGLGLYRTCQSLGLSPQTVNKHYQVDPVFKQAYDEALTEYSDELEATSRHNALNPRSVIERIFQLKALRPEKYGDSRTLGGSTQITINLGAEILELVKKRQAAIEAEVVKDSTPDLNIKQLENQAK